MTTLAMRTSPLWPTALLLAACSSNGGNPPVDAAPEVIDSAIDTALPPTDTGTPVDRPRTDVSDVSMMPDSGPADCSVLHAGTITGFVVDGLERSFILTLPPGTEMRGMWPVAFNWHGLGDTASNMSRLIAS